jgi:hypothetical protein
MASHRIVRKIVRIEALSTLAIVAVITVLLAAMWLDHTRKTQLPLVRLQRHSGHRKEACWRFVIQYGLKGRTDHRRWTEEEVETLREGLVKFSLEEMATKLHRSPKALREKLGREGYNIREIRCDLFSVESLACAVRVGRSQVLFWIEQGWLPVTVERCRRKHRYTITPEALTFLYKNHLHDLLKHGVSSQSLFEAYVQYCYSPKHTVGEQLLNVRRDKRERAAYEQAQQIVSISIDEHSEAGDEDYDENEDRYTLSI